MTGQVTRLGEIRIPVSAPSMRQNNDGTLALLLRNVNLYGDTATPTVFIFEVRKLDGRHGQWSWLVRLLGGNRPKKKGLLAQEENGRLA
jgi:hypothetical protein